MKAIFHRAINLVIKFRLVILLVLLPALSIYSHYKFFGLDLQGVHAWRQTETQNTINNFAEKDFNIMNPRENSHGNKNDIYRLEFPLMQWTYAIFFKIFGDHIIISRILTFIIGLFCVFGIYRIAYVLTSDYLLALLCAFVFNFGPAFYFYTLNPMPDTMALCFAIWGLFHFFTWVLKGRQSSMILCILLFSTSTLIKLPFIVNFSIIGGYQLMLLFRERFKNIKKVAGVFLVCLLFLAPALAWYAWVIPTWAASGTISGIIGLKKSQLPALLDIFKYNVMETFPHYLVNVFAVPVFIFGLICFMIRKAWKSYLFPALFTWFIFLLLYYIYEINTIGLWHDYYFFPVLPFIYIIMMYGLRQLMQKRQMIPVLMIIVLCMLMPKQAKQFSSWRWAVNKDEMNPDYITCKEQLRKAVPDNALVVVANDITPCIDLYYIHKSGWVVDNFWLPEDTLVARINNGAKYFYCDTRRIDDYEKITPHLGKKILECNTIRVWELKK